MPVPPRDNLLAPHPFAKRAPHSRRGFAGAIALPALLAGVLASPSAASPDVSNEVFYHFMPIAWRDGNGDSSRFGDFAGMTASLDYLDELGVTAIWMNPIFPSPAYHGYQHGRADLFNPRHGSEAEFVTFLEAAHARGLRVYVDFVAYGISHDSPWFDDAYANPGSPYDAWLAFTNGGNTEYWGSSYTTWNGDPVGFIHWDLRHPGPVDLVTTWAQRLLDPNDDGDFTDGLDGFRLDHVWNTYPNGPDGWGYHVDSFWAPWREALRNVNPDVFVFAEQADWGSHGTELYGGLDASFTKPFEFAARDALANEDAGRLYDEMANTLQALAAAPVPGAMLCTIGDHDVDRLASVIGDSFAKGKAAAAVLLTQPLPPVIYYGDEIGMRGRKNTGYSGDAADIPMREPFKWNAVAGAPMSNYFVLNGPAYNGRVARDHDGRSVEEQDDVAGSLLETYRQLIAVRRANPALSAGSYHPIETTSSRVWSFVRYDDGAPPPRTGATSRFTPGTGSSQAVLVAINLHGSPHTIQLDLSAFELPNGDTTPRDLLTGAFLPPLTAGNQAAYNLSLPAYGTALLEVDVVPPPPPVSLVDGRTIPADFGAEALLATQNNGTSFGDHVAELDQLYLRTQRDSLVLGISGNLAADGTGFVLCFDTGPGGQNELDLANIDPPPSGPRELTGLRFDAGFAPDLVYFVNSFGSTYWVDRFTLRSTGGADRVYRGSGTVGLGSGFLGGGDNPEGVQLALDNTNTAGVTESDASGAGTATTGFEFFLPFAELGLSTTETSLLGISVFLARQSGEVGNQWLPGLGGGYGSLGFAPDLGAVPGEQHIFLGLDPESTGTGEVIPADSALRLHLAGASPAVQEARLAFTLDAPAHVRLVIHDATGRAVRTLVDAPLTAGRFEFTWNGHGSDGDRSPAGVYFARLSWTNHAQQVRIVLLH